MRKQFLLGLMAMSLPLTTWAQTFTVNVTPKSGDAIVYAGDDTKNQFTVTVTDGESETPLTLGQDYVVYYYDATGTTETPVRAAGTYTVKVYGQQNYSRYTVGTETFTVAKKSVNARLGLQSASKTYGDSDQSLLDNLVKTIPDGVLAAGDPTTERTDFLKCLQVDRYGEDAKGEDVKEGGYQVIVNGKTGETESNYSYTSTQEGDVVTLTINRKELTAEITQDDTYNGYPKDLTWYITNNKVQIAEGGIIEGDEDKVEISALTYEGEGEVKNAGDYALTAELSGEKSGNYTIGKVNLTITPATLTITKKSGTDADFKMDFDGKTVTGDLTEKFDYTKFFNKDEEAILKEELTMEWKADNANAGEEGHEVLPYVKGEPLSETNKLQNYNIVYEDVAKFVINPKNISGVTIEISDLTYQGKQFSVEGLLTVTDNDITDEEGNGTKLTVADYDIEDVGPFDGDGMTNAKEKFMVVLTGKGNYKGTALNTNGFEIKKAALTISAKEGDDVKWSKEYTAVEYQDVLTDQFDYVGFKGEDDAASIGLSMKKRYSNPSVGTYSVLVFNGKELYDEEENAFTNYEISYEDVATFEITPATLKYSIMPDTITYNGTQQEVNFVTVDDKENGFGFKGNDSWGNIARTDMTKVVKPEIAVEDEDTKNAGNHKLILLNEEEVSAGPNYNVEYVEADAYLTIEPSTVNIKISNKSVRFEEFADELSEEKLADLAQSTSFTDIKNVPSDDKVGRKALRDMITLELQNGAETGASGTYENGIVATINPATPEDEVMLKNYGYGLVDEEGNPTHFIIKNGTLTIGGVAALELDGAENADDLLAEDPEAETIPAKLARLNGAKVDKVTIKNLRNITPAHSDLYTGMWYSLVLPFDVTVREISNNFKYAIVDIPYEDNTDPDVISFKLTMGKVPANTMMLFKVDENQNWEDKAMEFTEKTIVYNPEAEPLHDKANNYFMPVYQATPLDADTQWYMYFDGEPKNAAKNPMTMYPFNGYIEAVAGAAARIIVEEADGSTTAINAVNAEKVNAAEGWYSVDGMKLNAQPTKKGIYINNGKKVVIK